MRRFIPTSMRARLMLLVLLAIIPVLGLLLHISFEERRLAAIDAQENALTLVQLLKADQERTVEGARQLLIALTQLRDVRSDDPATCVARLTELLKLYPGYSGFGVAEADGDIVCSTVPPAQPINAVEQQLAWFRRAVETRTFAVGDYQEGPRTGSPILTFAYPILAGDDQLQGVVFAVIRLAALNQLADEAGLSQEAALIAIDRNGTILDRYPQPEEWVGESLSDAPLIQTILARREGVAEVAGPDGITRLYAFTPVRSSVDTGIYLGVGIPLQTAFAEADQRLVRNLGALGLIAALTIAAALYFSDLFVMRQMNALVKTTRRLKQGDLSARSVVSGTTQLDQLAQALNDMAAALEQREAERRRAEEALRESNAILQQAEQAQRLLVEAEQRARQDAERAAERIARLQSLTASLSKAITPAQVADACIKQMVAALGASAGNVTLLTDDGKELEVIADVGYPPGFTEHRHRSPASAASPIGHAVQIGEPVFLESREQALAQYPRFELDITSGHSAWAAIPLLVEDRAIGTIGLSFSEVRTFSAEDREFLMALSGQCAQALERARLYAAELEARAEAEVAQQRMAFLAEASQALMAKTDLDARLESVTRLVVPRLADWCTIHLVEADESIRLLTAAHRDPAKSARIMALVQSFPLDPDAPSGVPLVLRTGKPEIAVKVSDELLRAMAEDAGHLRGLQELGIESYLIVPLVARGRTLGAMTLASALAGRRYAHRDLALVEELADRVALSVDNALLYQETHLLNAELEQRAAKRTAQLQASNDRLRKQIAERRRAEEALQRSQRQYEELVDAVNGIVWEADAQTLEFHFVSRQAERMLGYPTTRWITEPTFWIDHIHPDDREWVIDYCTRAIAEQRLHEFEYRMIADDGREVWLRNMVTVVVRDDRPVKVRGVMTDITERKRAEAELAEMQRRMMESREAERLHLAQELHDGPVQDLYGISFRLAGLRDAPRLRNGEAAEQLAAGQQGLNQVIQTLRGITSELRPPTLAPFGLEKAIRSHAERFQEAHPELELHLDLMPDQQKLPEPMRLALFRIYQQTLTNVIRHADARQATIRFQLGADRATLEIEDDGRGFDVPARWIDLVRQGHLGLAGAVERAEAVGGRLKVISAPGHGTRVQVSVPTQPRDNGPTR
ncbi:MAG TPA: GAF domain-containing protein [Anaerolineae bacterium]|nr:GAF domain-containing protein [Anaerolineae bacterium]